MAERVPGAKLVELPGIDHIPWVGDQDALLEEVEEFLTGTRPHATIDRVLATVLFTDIVGSTTLAAEPGDRRWRDLLQSYYTLARRELDTSAPVSLINRRPATGSTRRASSWKKHMVETLGIHIALGLPQRRRPPSHPRFDLLEVADLTHVTGDGL
jgi:hypothetical protein